MTVEYFADVNSLIPVGEIGQTLNIFRQDLKTNKCEMASALVWRDIGVGASYPIGDAFIKSERMSFGSEFCFGEIREFLQAMSDVAWKNGIKPKQMTEATAELSAVRAHLDDMRAIVATKLEAPLMFRSGPSKP